MSPSAMVMIQPVIPGPVAKLASRNPTNCPPVVVDDFFPSTTHTSDKSS